MHTKTREELESLLEAKMKNVVFTYTPFQPHPSEFPKLACKWANNKMTEYYQDWISDLEKNKSVIPEHDIINRKIELFLAKPSYPVWICFDAVESQPEQK